MTLLNRELKQLADICGVLTAYEDVYRQRQQACVESLLAVLNALGVEVQSLGDVPPALRARQLARNRRGLEPVIVAWDGTSAEFELTLPEEHAEEVVASVVTLEDQSGTFSQQHDLSQAVPRGSRCGGFVSFRLPLPRGLKWGYHDLAVTTSRRAYEALIISAPTRAYSQGAALQRDWGCFLPLYALRTGRNWGAGDFTDLQRLAAWTANLGGRVVGTLPLLAAFLDQPCEPSPYAPASRLAWNEFYIDVARVPEFQQTPAALRLVQSADFAAQCSRLRHSEFVEYRALMALKRRLLERLAESFFVAKPASRFAEFERFRRAHPHIGDYARFRAAHERRGAPWQDWEVAMRDGDLSDGDYDRAAKLYHHYVQWIAHEQLQSLAETTGGGLYLDLPLGVRPDGYDVWRWRQSYASCASAGSPPDAMWTRGQDWCFPPLHPEAIREQRYGHVRDYLRHHMQLARMLRIDHVMQLHRLYWIPRGLPPDQGVYVKYRADELYAILALESHRCQTTLVGENLGTVPPEVNRAMDRHKFQRMYVVQYEVAVDDGSCRVTPSGAPAEAGPLQSSQRADARRGVPPALSEVPAGAMASLNTHDMPTFESWWQGKDIPFREALGLLDANGARRERQRLQVTRARLTSWLRHEGWLTGSETRDLDILRAILRFLAASPAGVVLVNLEDLWLETEPQNVPGTGNELPNWRRQATLTLEEVTQRRDVANVLQEVAQLRGATSAPASTTTNAIPCEE